MRAYTRAHTHTHAHMRTHTCERSASVNDSCRRTRAALDTWHRSHNPAKSEARLTTAAAALHNTDKEWLNWSHDICAGTRPTSAPGPAHICAGTARRERTDSSASAESGAAAVLSERRWPAATTFAAPTAGRTCHVASPAGAPLAHSWRHMHVAALQHQVAESWRHVSGCACRSAAEPWHADSSLLPRGARDGTFVPT